MFFTNIEHLLNQGDRMPTYMQYWGKTNREEKPFEIHLLPYHNLDVAACLHVLLERENHYLDRLSQWLRLDSSETVRVLTFLYALHDVGKYSADFQAFSKDALEKLGIEPYTPSQKFPIRHDVALHYLLDDGGLLDDLERDKILTSDDTYLLHQLMVSVAGHHGYPTPIYRNPKAREIYKGNQAAAITNMKRQFPDKNRQDILAYCQALKELWGPVHLDLEPLEYTGNLAMTSWLLAGVGTIADWLGSARDYFPFVGEPIDPDKDCLALYWQEQALPRARRALSESGIASVPTVSGRTRFEHILPPDANLRPLQEWARDLDLQKGPKLIVVEDAPGSGKTEVALSIARECIQMEDAEGIYFALPTQVSSNAMFDRVKNFCDTLFLEDNKGTLTLAHGASRLSQEFRDIKLGRMGANGNDGGSHVECPQWLGDSRKRSLLSQIGVGTIDQALISVLPKYHSNIRMAGLVRNVLIVDEVHAYQEYQSELLCKLLGFYGKMGLPAILLSATLHSTLRQKLVDAYAQGTEQTVSTDPACGYPLGTVFSVVNDQAALEETETAAHRRRSYVIDVIEDDQKQTGERVWTSAEQQATVRLIQAANDGRCAVWFRNTVRDARLAYEHVSSVLGESNVLLAHARFTRHSRTQIDQQALNLFGKDADPSKRAGKVVICTQVFQESLDLDFDEAISDLAEVDVLLQRFGRVRRHKRRLDGTLIEDPNIPDERGEPVPVTLVIPKFSEEPDANWYKKMSFSSTRWVYQDVARMWRTAKLAVSHPEWKLPSDVRFLMESVYGPNAEEPASLVDDLLANEGDRIADRQLARNYSFEWQKGYYDASATWTVDDEQHGAPTRLGEPSTLWRLAKYNRDRDLIIPYEDVSDMAWAYSQLSLRDNLIAEVHPSPEAAKALERQKDLASSAEHHLFDASWVHYLVLEKDPDGTWGANGFTPKSQMVEVWYTNIRGLEHAK